MPEMSISTYLTNGGKIAQSVYKDFLEQVGDLLEGNFSCLHLVWNFKTLLASACLCLLTDQWAVLEEEVNAVKDIPGN